MRIRLLVVAVLAGVGLISAPAAYAHDQLTASSPEQGQLLETAPSTVSITFNEEVLDIGNAIVVLDNAGTDWVDGDVTVTGSTVTAALQSGMPDGVYTMNWRVVSADGHPVSSSIVFGVGSSELVKDELATAIAAVGQPADDGDGDADAATDEPLVTAAAAGNDTGSTIAIGAIGAVVAIALFLGGFAAIRRGRANVRRATENSTESSQQ